MGHLQRRRRRSRAAVKTSHHHHPRRKNPLLRRGWQAKRERLHPLPHLTLAVMMINPMAKSLSARDLILWASTPVPKKSNQSPNSPWDLLLLEATSSNESMSRSTVHWSTLLSMLSTLPIHSSLRPESQGSVTLSGSGQTKDSETSMEKASKRKRARWRIEISTRQGRGSKQV